MWMGVHAPRRVESLVLANTAARIGSVEMWTERIAFVRQHGMAALAEMTMPRWFTEAFRSREPQTVEQFKAMVESCSQDGYLGCCAALRDEDLREAIAAIRCPVLAIAGSADVATPPEALRFIHERIAGSQLVTLDAAHLSNVEQHEAFNDALLDFWNGSGSSRKTRLYAIALFRHVDGDRLAEPRHRRVTVVAGLHHQLVRAGRQLHVDGVVAHPEVHPRIGLRDDRSRPGRQSVSTPRWKCPVLARTASGAISPGGTAAIVNMSLAKTMCTGLFTVAPFFGSAKYTLPPPGCAV